MSRKNRDNGISDTMLPGHSAAVEGQPETSTVEGNGTAPKEDGYAKYRRLRSKRTVKLEQYVRLLANLGNRRSYPWTDEDKEVVLNFMARMEELVRNSLTDTKAAKTQMGI